MDICDALEPGFRLLGHREMYLFPAKLSNCLLLSLIKAEVDNLQRRNLKNGEREQVHLIPRERKN